MGWLIFGALKARLGRKRDSFEKEGGGELTRRNFEEEEEEEEEEGSPFELPTGRTDAQHHICHTLY